MRQVAPKILACPRGYRALGKEAQLSNYWLCKTVTQGQNLKHIFQKKPDLRGNKTVFGHHRDSSSGSILNVQVAKSALAKIVLVSIPVEPPAPGSGTK